MAEHAEPIGSEAVKRERRERVRSRSRAERRAGLRRLAMRIALIAALAAVPLAWVLARGKRTVCEQPDAEVARVMCALEEYRFDHGAYPTLLTELETSTCSCGRRCLDALPAGTWTYDPTPNTSWPYTLGNASTGCAAGSDLPIDAWRARLRAQHAH